MSPDKICALILFLSLLCAGPLLAAEAGSAQGTIFTLWPLVDYRESPKEGFSNLAILGPLIKFQKRGDARESAFRPFFFRSYSLLNDTSETDYLFPLASDNRAPDTTRFQMLLLFQSNSYHRDEPSEKRDDSMFFPFYITGTSEKHGEYTSVFPFYGDIYERFWRDEYHYVLFPLYGRTVKGSTTNRNYLYPFFGTTEGPKESGFHFWPLYGQAEKEGVYRTHYALWPIYLKESTGLDSSNPTEKLMVLPLYHAVDSPNLTSRFYLWPFFGYTDDAVRKEHEIDYLWPLVWTVRGEKRHANSMLPFYSEDRNGENLKRWYLWPIYKHEELDSAIYRQDLDRIIYFLYTDRREYWPKDGSVQRRTALWPLFLYNRDPHGIRSLSIPAPVESVFDREGIERNWAPLWRLYQHRWNDSGDSAVSILWNLYWHEARGEDLAYELFPLVFYRTETGTGELSLLKGLVRYRNNDGEKSLAFLWLPFGLYWGEKNVAAQAAPQLSWRSE